MKNKNKIRALMLVVGLCALPLFAMAEDEQTFSDVPPTHPNFDAIEFLANEGIVGGYPDGSFNPSGTINRAEAMKLIVLAESTWFGQEFSEDRIAQPVIETDEEGNETVVTPVFTFNDVPGDAWFTPYVYNAYDRDIVGGYEGGEFRPGNNINKAESLKIVLLTFTEGADFAEPGKNPFPDVPFSAWYAPYVQYSKDRFIIEPDQYGNYNPGLDITRAEFSEMVYRLLYMAEHEQDAFDPSINWELINRSLQGYTMKIPPHWEMFEERNEHPASGNPIRTIFWHRDDTRNQRTYMRQYPNSATAEIVVGTEAVDQSKFFGEIRNAFGGNAVVIETTTNDMPTLVVESSNGTEVILDAYIVLPDSHIVSILGTYGNGPLAYKHAFQLRKIRENFRFTERSIVDDSNIEDVMTIARQNIQVDGKGTETLQLFDDLQLIETDTIGVGTGPVDYYYSAKADSTLKHERSFDVILDIEDGETSGF